MRNTQLRVKHTLYVNTHVLYSAHVYSAHIPGQLLGRLAVLVGGLTAWLVRRLLSCVALPNRLPGLPSLPLLPYYTPL